MAFTSQEIRGGLQVDPFVVRVDGPGRETGEWAITWSTVSGEDVAIAGFKETDDGIHWNRFYVREPFRGRGIYSRLVGWSYELGVEVFATDLPPHDWDGFTLRKDGKYRLDGRKARAFVKDG